MNIYYHFSLVYFFQKAVKIEVLCCHWNGCISFLAMLSNYFHNSNMICWYFSISAFKVLSIVQVNHEHLSTAISTQQISHDS